MIFAMSVTAVPKSLPPRPHLHPHPVFQRLLSASFLSLHLPALFVFLVGVRPIDLLGGEVHRGQGGEEVHLRPRKNHQLCRQVVAPAINLA